MTPASRLGFASIELLIVIAIILVLIALLLPALEARANPHLALGVAEHKASGSRSVSRPLGAAPRFALTRSVSSPRAALALWPLGPRSTEEVNREH